MTPDDLLWHDDLHMGHWVPPVYGPKMQEEQRRRAASDIGSRLTNLRADLVQVWCLPTPSDLILDFGSGSGAFVGEMNRRGFRAEAHDLHDPSPELWKARWDIVTFWDTLEHVIDPIMHLQLARKYAVVTLPVADTCADWLKSKHYKPPEHLSYWSQTGFIEWVRRFTPFEVLASNAAETTVGRDSVVTFLLFRQAAWPRSFLV